MMSCQQVDIYKSLHVGATSVERPLVEEVKAFFDDERLLFWVEVVCWKLSGQFQCFVSRLSLSAVRAPQEGLYVFPTTSVQAPTGEL